jgi:steroid 5-alpha reductase family enzyme
MSVLHLLAINAVVLIGVFGLFWLVTLKTRDVTPIDSIWALGMVVLGWTSFVQTSGDPGRKMLLMLLCTAWGVRLGGYLFWRWRHHGADRRYQTMFAKAQADKGWGFNQASLRLVYAVQAPMLFIVCLPVQLGQLDGAPPVGVLGMLGAALAAIGIVFETVGDWQLVAFRREQANVGKVLRSGLWRYTRHPNYFGDACVWWGLYLIAAESVTGLWALPGPILLTFTLIKWSGVPTVEGRMKRKKPDYEDYVRRTSGFVPWFPKRA